MLIRTRVFTRSGIAGRFLHPSASPTKATPSSVPPPRWHSVVLDDLTAARELLDRLERAGRTDREFRILDGERFEVHWRDPIPR